MSKKSDVGLSQDELRKTIRESLGLPTQEEKAEETKEEKPSE